MDGTAPNAGGQPTLVDSEIAMRIGGDCPLCRMAPKSASCPGTGLSPAESKSLSPRLPAKPLAPLRLLRVRRSMRRGLWNTWQLPFNTMYIAFVSATGTNTPTSVTMLRTSGWHAHPPPRLQLTLLLPIDESAGWEEYCKGAGAKLEHVLFVHAGLGGEGHPPGRSFVLTTSLASVRTPPMVADV